MTGCELPERPVRVVLAEPAATFIIETFCNDPNKDDVLVKFLVRFL